MQTHPAWPSSQCCTRSIARWRRHGCTSAASYTRRTRAVPSPCLFRSANSDISALSAALPQQQARTHQQAEPELCCCTVRVQRRRVSASRCTELARREGVRKRNGSGHTHQRAAHVGSALPRGRACQCGTFGGGSRGSRAREGAHLRIEQQRATPGAYDLALRRGASC